MSGRGGRGGRGGGRGGSRGKPAPPGMPGGDDPSLIVNDQPQETYPVYLRLSAYPLIRSSAAERKLLLRPQPADTVSYRNSTDHPSLLI